MHDDASALQQNHLWFGLPGGKVGDNNLKGYGGWVIDDGC